MDVHAEQTQAQPSRDFQPSFFGAGQDLPHGPWRLFRVLLSWRRASLKRGKEFVWPTQAELAKSLNKDRRTVQRYLDCLEAAGLIRKTRTLRGNRYYFLDPNEHADASKMSHADASKMSHADASKMSHADASKMSHTSSSDLEEEEENSSSAAADLFSPVEIQQAAQSLRELGFTCPLAERYAARDAGLVLVAVPHLRLRFQDEMRRAVRNRVAFARHLLDHPEEHGFEHVGHWKAPDETPSPKGPTKEDRKARVAAERHRRAGTPASVDELRQLADQLRGQAKTMPVLPPPVEGQAGEAQ